VDNSVATFLALTSLTAVAGLVIRAVVARQRSLRLAISDLIDNFERQSTSAHRLLRSLDGLSGSLDRTLEELSQPNTRPEGEPHEFPSRVFIAHGVGDVRARKIGDLLQQWELPPAITPNFVYVVDNIIAATAHDKLLDWYDVDSVYGFVSHIDLDALITVPIHREADVDLGFENWASNVGDWVPVLNAQVPASKVAWNAPSPIEGDYRWRATRGSTIATASRSGKFNRALARTGSMVTKGTAADLPLKSLESGSKG
jgi:hypothetical protein